MIRSALGRLRGQFHQRCLTWWTAGTAMKWSVSPVGNDIDILKKFTGGWTKSMSRAALMAAKRK